MTTSEKIEKWVNEFNWDDKKRMLFRDRKYTSGRKIKIDEDVILYGMLKEGDSYRVINFHPEEFGVLYKAEVIGDRDINERQSPDSALYVVK